MTSHVRSALWTLSKILCNVERQRSKRQEKTVTSFMDGPMIRAKNKDTNYEPVLLTTTYSERLTVGITEKLVFNVFLALIDRDLLSDLH